VSVQCQAAFWRLCRRYASFWTMTAQPQNTETTPLLRSQAPHSTRVTSETNGRVVLPAVQPCLLRVQDQGTLSHDEWCPDGLTTEVARVAFVLVVLLVYKANLRQRNRSEQDLWEQWSDEVKGVANVCAVERKVVEMWDTFLNIPRTAADIEQVLWQEFPLRQNDPYSRIKGQGYLHNVYVPFSDVLPG
jgi:hypothetical protein